MKPQTRNPNGGETDTPQIDATDMFGIFSAKRRQYALAYLRQKPAAIPIGDLAEYIALKEGEPSYDRYERILTDLYHNHLPRLTGLGVVRYDESEELVELAVDRCVITPYLRLTEHADA
ncbi:DUF7344 domain-containing protein [Natrialba swarupiae]|uniref:DUF7344 domain-containing protein n=1 Tax=Natrialba swarupiae TaxID=2448032 RepID=A0A5D5AQ56_9EURY|nr:hypothetical protein [Natrialba swarupiae]MCW8172641.1 hypothetical protein [Natrialba swarupiae]TYT63015.1 hypothetical protein FYC77_05050 [Natrialba swarupiae]